MSLKAISRRELGVLIQFPDGDYSFSILLRPNSQASYFEHSMLEADRSGYTIIAEIQL